MEAARDIDEYPTQALIIRRTFKQLSQPGGLIHRSHEWFSGSKAHWDGNNNIWTFPSGASIKFGYLEHEGDELNYQGGEYNIVCFDELTQLREYQYLYLYSRIRRLKDFPIPSRVRSASNPGGPGHEWVRKRWKLPHGPVYPQSVTRKFLSATLDDNPHIDREEYVESLKVMITDDGESVTYNQLRHGDWSATSSGGFINPQQIEIVDWSDVPPAATFENIIRYWDFAATKKTDLNPNPDWTAGAKIGRTLARGHRMIDPRTGEHILPIRDYYLFDMNRFRDNPGIVDMNVKSDARRDGAGVPIWVEQERGSAGKSLVWRYKNSLLPGYTVRGLFATGTKEQHAKGLASLIHTGHFYIVRGPWNEDFLAECGTFPEGDHDDQVDAASKGIVCLTRETRMASGGSVTRVESAGRRGQQEKQDRMKHLAGVHFGY